MSPQPSTAVQRAKETVPAKPTGSTNIFDQMNEVRDSIAKRAFEIFEGKGGWLGRELDDWLRAESELLHPMHLELAESDSDLTVKAEVPGFSAKDLEINIEPRRLTVTGKRETKEETKKGKTVYSELCGNEILRVIDLPAEVDISNVSAVLKDGVLNIKMAKAVAPKSVRVEQKSA